MTKNLKILHINTVATPSTAIGSIVQALHAAARSYGFKSAIVAGYGSAEHSNYVMQPKVRYYANVLEARVTGNDGFAARHATLRMLEYIEQYNPDIVHLHNLHGYYLNLPLLADWLKAHNKKVVMTLHDSWMLTGRCALPSQPGCDKWCADNCEACEHKLVYPSVWVNTKPKYKHDLFNAYYVVPSLTAQSVFSRSKLAAAPHSVIFNGADQTIYRRDGMAHKLSPAKVNLLAVAVKWIPVKNLDALLAVARIMPDDWHLTIVGKAKVPISKKITVVTHIDSAVQMAQYYRGADVLLSASLAESFGMTVAEALSCGTPAVVNQDTATCELITPRNGMVTDFSNPQMVIDAVNDVLGLKASTSYSSANMVARYFALYKSLLEETQ
jgi:glycosyltransferase involved in cell wall biosynthesis